MDAKWVKTLRENRGLTQSDLSQILGVSINTVQNWESGNTIPKTKEKLLLELAEKPINREYDVASAIKKIEAISEVTLSAVSELLAKSNGGSSTSILRSLEALVNERVNKQE